MKKYVKDASFVEACKEYTGIEPISSRKPYERSATELIPHL